MWQWDGRIGPAFIMTLGLAGVTALNFFYDNRAALAERLVRVETTIFHLGETVKRVEYKIDAKAK